MASVLSSHSSKNSIGSRLISEPHNLTYYNPLIFKLLVAQQSASLSSHFMINSYRFQGLDIVLLANTAVVIITFNLQSNVIEVSHTAGSNFEFSMNRSDNTIRKLSCAIPENVVQVFAYYTSQLTIMQLVKNCRIDAAHLHSY